MYLTLTQNRRLDVENKWLSSFTKSLAEAVDLEHQKVAAQIRQAMRELAATDEDPTRIVITPELEARLIELREAYDGVLESGTRKDNSFQIRESADSIDILFEKVPPPEPRRPNDPTKTKKSRPSKAKKKAKSKRARKARRKNRK